MNSGPCDLLLPPPWTPTVVAFSPQPHHGLWPLWPSSLALSFSHTLFSCVSSFLTLSFSFLPLWQFSLWTHNLPVVVKGKAKCSLPSSPPGSCPSVCFLRTNSLLSQTALPRFPSLPSSLPSWSCSQQWPWNHLWKILPASSLSLHSFYIQPFGVNKLQKLHEEPPRNYRAES